jgi:hypothetical protein
MSRKSAEEGVWCKFAAGGVWKGENASLFSVDFEGNSAEPMNQENVSAPTYQKWPRTLHQHGIVALLLGFFFALSQWDVPLLLEIDQLSIGRRGSMRVPCLPHRA